MRHATDPSDYSDFQFDGTACGSIKSKMRALGLVVAAGTSRSAVPAERDVL
jgi:hypothetical protein